jgi:hypothetical protein
MPGSAITPGSSLTLMRKRRGADFWGRADVSIRGVFDKEARRKPLAFAADEGYAAGTNYGIVAPTGHGAVHFPPHLIVELWRYADFQVRSARCPSGLPDR